MKNRIGKERIIYSNYDVTERYHRAKEFLFDVRENEGNLTEEEIWNQVYFLDEIDWEDVQSDLIQFFNNESNMWILMGSVGRWNGTYVGGIIFETFKEMFYEIAVDCEYIKFYDENGHLYLTCSHHDGTCSYEIKAITKLGEKYLYNWEENREYKRSKEYIYTQIFNRYSKLPHYAYKFFGSPKFEYEFTT